MKKVSVLILSGLMLLALAGCNKADTISHNIGQEADQFNVLRRIVLVNGITDKYFLSVEGYCSLGNDRNSVELNFTCQTGPNEYKKHFLGLSDNATYFVEQLEGINVDPYHYKVIIRPASLIPDIEIQ